MSGRRAGTPPPETASPHQGTSIDGAPVGSLLLQAVRAHARLATELLQEVGITPPHEIVLLYLDQHGPVPQTELVRYMGRDRSTVTATLQAMERGGLIARTASPDDKRAMTVSLTDRGKDKAPAARAAWRELEAATTSALGDAERQAFMRALVDIRDRLNEAIGQRRRAEKPRACR